MKSSWLVAFALAIGSAFANESAATSPANNQWQDWVTTTVYEVDYKTEYKTSVSVSVSVSYVTSYITVTGPTKTVTQTSYVSQAPATVTSTVVNVVPSVVVSTIQSIASVTAVVTVTSIRTVANVQTVTASALNGLVTCESRIINPTYTTSTPLPSNYLWGCPPGKLCYPPRIGCNFEQGLPADSYYCKPDDCRPVAALPPLDVYLRTNVYNNNSCAFITPIDDYFNLNPLNFGLNYGIFNIYGQKTCSASTACPSPTTVTVKQPQTVPIPTTLTIAKTIEVTKPVTLEVTKPVTVEVPSPVTVIAEKSSSTWAVWQGSAAPPKVTKRAKLDDVKRADLQALIAADACYVTCDIAAIAYQNVGPNSADLCDPNGDYIYAYNAVTDCVNAYLNNGGTASRQITELDIPRSICGQNQAKRALGRRFAW